MDTKKNKKKQVNDKIKLRGHQHQQPSRENFLIWNEITKKLVKELRLDDQFSPAEQDAIHPNHLLKFY